MRYPQSLFTEKIKNYITIEVKSIIDMPCGTGETSYELAQFFPSVSITGADLNDKNIKYAKEKFKLPNLKYQEADILDLVGNLKKIECFCLINSLFLLPNPKELLQKISLKLTQNGQLILILPNPQSTNFRRYQKIAPEVNTFILEKEDYPDFFKSVGLSIIHCEGIARIPIYGRWDTKLLYPIRDPYLFWLEKRSKSEDYGYFLVVLEAI